MKPEFESEVVKVRMVLALEPPEFPTKVTGRVEVFAEPLVMPVKAAASA